MKVGIAGSPQSGKTTLFRLLTGAGLAASQSSIGVMEVPDQRVNILSGIYQPRKITYARIDLVDIQAHKGQELLNAVRNLDVLIVVLGSFMGDLGVRDSIEFVSAMETDFYVADLVSVENRLEKLKANKAKPISQMELPFLEKCKDSLDKELPLRDVEYQPYEADLLSNFAFYTNKPVILAPNVSDEQLSTGSYAAMEQVRRLSESKGYKVVVYSGMVEEEIGSLSEEDRVPFFKEYGLTESGVARIARAAYSTLGLISFFTVGSDEVRAWTIRQGTAAKEAAGKIHTDLERGFIRAEVVSFQDFSALGSMKVCRDKGLVRLEGKDYVVRDGDIMNVRFNV
jgi:GTP-binding protein YchF